MAVLTALETHRLAVEVAKLLGVAPPAPFKQTPAPRPPPPPAPKPRPGSDPRTWGPQKTKKLPAECNLWGDAFAPAPAVPGGIQKLNARATYHFYSPQYDTGTLACADRFWADPGHAKKLLKYPWTAFCLGKFSQDVCGKCLRVTNRRTGASVIARAVDNGGCSDADGTGLDLDPCAFNAIDGDKRGYMDGFMRVDVQEVEC